MEEIVITDSDVVIDYFNGINPQADILAALIQNQSLGLTTISVFELHAGITGKKRLEALRLLMSQAIIVPLDEKAAQKAASLYTELKRKGELIGNQDILIAGTCLVNNLPLYTRNLNHFQRISHLRFYTNP